MTQAEQSRKIERFHRRTAQSLCVCVSRPPFTLSLSNHIYISGNERKKKKKETLYFALLYNNNEEGRTQNAEENKKQKLHEEKTKQKTNKQTEFKVPTGLVLFYA